MLHDAKLSSITRLRECLEQAEEVFEAFFFFFFLVYFIRWILFFPNLFNFPFLKDQVGFDGNEDGFTLWTSRSAVQRKNNGSF